jgi:hypothetical protein
VKRVGQLSNGRTATIELRRHETVRDMGVLAASVATFARLAGDHDPWTLYAGVGGLALLVGAWVAIGLSRLRS